MWAHSQTIPACGGHSSLGTGLQTVWSTFSDFSVGFCINEEKGYLLPVWSVLRNRVCQHCYSVHVDITYKAICDNGWQDSISRMPLTTLSLWNHMLM